MCSLKKIPQEWATEKNGKKRKVVSALEMTLLGI